MASFLLGRAKTHFVSFPRRGPRIQQSASSSRICRSPAEPIKEPFILVQGRPQLGGGGGAGDGSGGNGGFCGGGRGGGGDDAAAAAEEEEEISRIMELEGVTVVAEEVGGAVLPAHMLEPAVIRPQFLLNQMMAYLFKLGTMVVIGSCRAAFAEFQRGKELWSKLELHKALVGMAVNAALVGMLASYAPTGKPSVSTAAGLGRNTEEDGAAALPSTTINVVEAERPGRRSSLMRRVATSFYKGFWYSSAAIGCGLLGQGIATTAMNVNRTVENSEENIHVPLQMESGIPQGVAKALPLLRQAPPLPEASTVGVPITNNIVNNMQVPPPPEASAVGVPFTNNINIYGAGVDGNLSLLLIIFAILFLILVFIIVGGIVLTY